MLFDHFQAIEERLSLQHQKVAIKNECYEEERIDFNRIINLGNNVSTRRNNYEEV